jgi:hypothetical protein
MLFKIVNITPHPVELIDIGTTLFPDTIVDLTFNEVFISEELEQAIKTNKLVFIKDTIRLDRDQSIIFLAEINTGFNFDDSIIINAIENKLNSDGFIEEIVNKIETDNFSCYTQDEVDVLLSGKTDLNHQHPLLVTKSENDFKLESKAPVNHLHDERYVLRGELDSVHNFGKNFLFFENDSVITTNGENFIQHDAWNFTILDPCTLRISWYYNWNISSMESSFNGFLVLKKPNYENLCLSDIFAKTIDSGNNYFGSTGSSQKQSESGFKHLSLEAGTYNLKLLVRADYAEIETSTWNRRVEIWRVT